MNTEESSLLDIGLPKWPQMKVTGKSVTPEQASEILRRTDRAMSGRWGNDRQFSRRVGSLLRMPPLLVSTSDFFDSLKKFTPGTPAYRDADFAGEADAQEWMRRWGYIETDYVCNRWVSSAFIYGPHGWCRPDGIVEFGYNVGKWPSVEEVMKDWEIIAESFLFLEIDVTLMSGEDGEEGTVPLVGFMIREGRVKIVDPATTVLHAFHEDHTYSAEHKTNALHAIAIGPLSRECGVPESMIAGWARIAEQMFTPENSRWLRK